MKVDLYKQKRHYKTKEGKEGDTTDLILYLPIGKDGVNLQVKIKPAFDKDKASWALLLNYAQAIQ